ncbi:AMP-binding protein [Mesorhizobium sp. SARCC-RB16n]|uniref:AMP-binding protein n=1 Tax=Mesorhizobium sp. SARCC-RB16n TaxID=2116687 RepID=UPI00166785AF|nr:AMP-binding protein [Mesorhizobium sp. SARCC-RB16n]
MLLDVVDRFLSMASRYPERLAIDVGARQFSYAWLEERVRIYAEIFSSFEQPRIAIALPQEADAYACILAAGLAGGFHTPLNTAAPIQKLRRILHRLQPNIVVAKPKLAAEIADAVPNLKVVDPDSINTDRCFLGKGTRHHLAYVMFTSGSTGDPKGVMVSRAALANYVDWLESLSITPQDRISQQPNLAFDISMTDIFGALCHGASLHPLRDEGDRMLPAEFIARQGITIWNSTPSAVSLMMRARQVTANNLGSVRLFNFCGEPLVRQQLDAIFAAVPEALAQNTYGPTEATISVTEQVLTPDNYASYCHTSAALGRSIQGMKISLVGGSSANEGQIVISGPQLAEGYWNDPEKSEQQFRELDELSGERGYLTGDWAEIRGDRLFFKERIDFQVKVKGYRIELDEVVSAIRQCGWPVAIVFKRGDGLAAVVESNGLGLLDERKLKVALSEIVEAHAVPTWILEIPRAPRSENDKLDRTAAAAWFEDNLVMKKERT